MTKAFVRKIEIIEIVGETRGCRANEVGGPGAGTQELFYRPYHSNCRVK